MTHDDTTAARPLFPHCQLPIQDGESSILHEGHSFHRRCAPVPEIAGEKDDIYPDRIAI